jgi:hypothetical protein
VSGSEPSDAIRAVNALLTQLDALRRHPNVMVLTTSNITEAIDLAFVDRADIKVGGRRGAARRRPRASGHKPGLRPQGVTPRSKGCRNKGVEAPASAGAGAALPRPQPLP